MKRYGTLRSILRLSALFMLMALLMAGTARAQEAGGALGGGAGIFRPKNPETTRRRTTPGIKPPTNRTPAPRPTGGRGGTVKPTTLPPEVIEERFEDALEAGNTARDARKYAEAEKAYREAGQLKPADWRGWYGLGTALETLLAEGPKGKRLLREMHASWPFFQTLIDNAELTMRKADMGIARVYSSLVEDEAIRERILHLLGDEFLRTEKAILAITGKKQLLGREPVLLNSVELRNPYIDPLNYLQVDLLRRLRSGKLRKAAADNARSAIELTINGISGGLKNTG